MYSAIVPDKNNELISVDLSEIMDEKIAGGRASDDTIRSYKSQLKLFLTWCKQNRIEPLFADEASIEKYRRYLNKKRFKVSTIATKLTIVRRFYGLLVEREIIANNPAARVKPPVERYNIGASTNFLSKDEAKQLVKTLPQDNSLAGLRDRLIVALMMIEGCRQIELNRLNYGDLATKNGKTGITVRGKRSIRTIPLNKDVSQLLNRYLKARRKQEKLRTNSPIFISVSPRNYGGRLTRRSMARIADKYLKLAELKEEEGRKVSPHGLRHTAGYLCQLSGLSLRQTQDFLGHSDPKIPAIYAHLVALWDNPPASGFGIAI